MGKFPYLSVPIFLVFVVVWCAVSTEVHCRRLDVVELSAVDFVLMEPLRVLHAVGATVVRSVPCSQVRIVLEGRVMAVVTARRRLLVTEAVRRRVADAKRSALHLTPARMRHERALVQLSLCCREVGAEVLIKGHHRATHDALDSLGHRQGLGVGSDEGIIPFTGILNRSRQSLAEQSVECHLDFSLYV